MAFWTRNDADPATGVNDKVVVFFAACAAKKLAANPGKAVVDFGNRDGAATGDESAVDLAEHA